MQKVVALCFLLFAVVCNARLNQAFSGPTPGCLSQIYQALNVLYDFGNDAGTQDLTELINDYESLNPIIHGINENCEPKINTTAPETPSEDCNGVMDVIDQIIRTFKSGDPTNYLNVINTVQELFNVKNTFNEKCVSGVQKQCKSHFSQAARTLMNLSQHISERNFETAMKDLMSLKPIVSNINHFCERKISSNKSKNPTSVLDHFKVLKNLLKKLDKVESENLADLLQSVWDLVQSFHL